MKLGRGLFEELPIVGVNDRLYEAYVVMLGQRHEAPPQRCSAGELAVLFGHAAAGAKPAPGRDHHCCDRS